MDARVRSRGERETVSTLSSSAHDLTNRIAGPCRYKFNVSVEAIAAEQARLVGGTFLEQVSQVIPGPARSIAASKTEA